jgi:flagellar motility protein MotE (MotC chaperone)
MRFRLLPIVIAAAIIAVPVRLGNVWQVVQDGGPALAEEQVQSEENEASDELEASDGVDLVESGAPISSAIQDASGAGDAQEMSSSELAGDGLEGASFPADPFALTDEELELLQSLAKRRAELEQREREIEDRLAILTAAETRIEEKIAKLESLRRTIEQVTTDSEARHGERIASLARIYSAMKPKEAAKIFATMEMPVLLDLLSQMRERKSAAILAKMDPSRAQAVTLQLAQREKLPLPKE